MLCPIAARAGHTHLAPRPIAFPPITLCSTESLRIGFMLSQGGEFAFVLLSLAAQLKVLPQELNQVWTSVNAWEYV